MEEERQGASSGAPSGDSVPRLTRTAFLCPAINRDNQAETQDIHGPDPIGAEGGRGLAEGRVGGHGC